MTKPAVALLVCLALSLTLPPTMGLAGDRRHAHGGFQAHRAFRPHGGFHGGHGSVGSNRHHGQVGRVGHGHFAGKLHHDRVGHGHFAGKLHHDRFFRGRFVSWFPPSVVYYTAPLAYSPPSDVSPSVVVYSSPTVYAPIVVSSPPPAVEYSPPPTAAPMPTVVEYSTGRYELRGDGQTTPYVWVWVPNPPLAAPPQAAAEPATGSAAPGTPNVYRWTDEHGTTVWTNRPDKVPERYRSGAEPAPADSDPS